MQMCRYSVTVFDRTWWRGSCVGHLWFMLSEVYLYLGFIYLYAAFNASAKESLMPLSLHTFLIPCDPSHPYFPPPYQIISNTERLDGKTPADIEKIIRKACHEVKLSSDICVLPYGITIANNFELKYPGKR